MALKEYAITYTYKNVSNSTGIPSPVATNNYIALPRSGFTASGATDLNVGKITRIVFNHTHTATNPKVTIALKGRIGSVDSDTVTHNFDGDIFTYTNTWYNPTGIDVGTWTECRIVAASDASKTSSTLYYRSTSDYRITITVYFWRKEDMCEGATAPTIGTSTKGDGAGLYSTYSGYVSGFSKPILTYAIGLDWTHFDYITAVANASVKIGNSVKNYSTDIDTNNRNAVIQLGTLPQSSGELSIAVTLTVTDLAGNVATKSETIKAYAYKVPTLTVQARRASKNTSNLFEPVGTGTALQLNAKVSGFVRVNSQSSYSIKLAFKEESASAFGSAITVASGKTANYTYDDYANGTAILDASETSKTLDSRKNYSYRVTFSDGISTITYNGSISAGSAIFNIEPNGVAIGKISTGTSSNMKFECAYPATFEKPVTFVEGVSGISVAKGGTVTPVDVKDGTVIEASVSFTAFKTVPFVACTLYSTATTNLDYLGACSVVIKAVRTNGFDYRLICDNGHSSTIKLGFTWLAIANE